MYTNYKTTNQMPQYHFQGSLADKIKLAGVADVWTLGGFFNICLMICVVVMIQCGQGHWPGYSAH